MKSIYMLAAIALFSLTLHAKADCVNLVGNYQWTSTDDSGDFLKIAVTQNACTTMREVHDQGWGFTVTRDHIFDGQKHLVEDDGDFQAYETATIDAGGTRMLEERHSTDDDGKPVVVLVETDLMPTKDGGLQMNRVFMNEDKTVTDQDQTTLVRMQ